MKLCPQCEFLYEDDQIFCDMDGEGLVYDIRAAVLPGVAPEAPGTGPKGSPLRTMVVAVVAGLLLATLLSLVYYASARSLRAGSASPGKQPETSRSGQSATAPLDNTSTQPPASPAQSPVNPDADSESPSVSADQPANQSVAQAASKARANTMSASDNRLMISKRVPPLPQLNPIPQLLPPQRLAAAKPTATVPLTTMSGKVKTSYQTTTETNQKSVIVEVKPASRNPTRRSKVGAFLKKTGRILKKPFQL